MTQFYLIVALLLATLVAIFAVQNAAEITVRFLVWTFQSSVVVVILISAGMGALLAALVSLPQTLKRDADSKRPRRSSSVWLDSLAGRKGGPARSKEKEKEAGCVTPPWIPSRSPDDPVPSRTACCAHGDGVSVRFHHRVCHRTRPGRSLSRRAPWISGAAASERVAANGIPRGGPGPARHPIWSSHGGGR